MEGKVFNLARRAKYMRTPLQWLVSLTHYWKAHLEHPSGVYHPTHKSKDEKRLLRNKRARLKRRRSKK